MPKTDGAGTGARRTAMPALRLDDCRSSLIFPLLTVGEGFAHDCGLQQEVADRLPCDEGSLAGSFDRTLSHLERLQRARLGRPAPPTLKVGVSR